MARVYNFSAGPAVLPEEVLKQAASEMLDYEGTGMSVMEMSHRSAAFTKMLSIPDNYKVLFLQGGDSLLFASVFMNLATNGKADYIVTGGWSKKAYKEAQILGDPKLLVNGEGDNFSWIPDLSDLDIRDDTSFVYICDETVYGNRIYTLPNTKGHVLVSDQSSMFLSEPVDVSKYGLIHAGVQKNCGPAGVQIVIVREDLIPEDLPGVPTMLRFKTHADSGSQHPTELWHLHLRTRLQVDSGAGRSRGDEEAQRGQGQASLRLPRLERHVLEYGQSQGPLHHERPVHHGR